MAQTTNKNRTKRDARHFSDPAAAAAKIYQGALVVLDAAGNAAPGSTALNLTARGVATDYVDNSAGAAGDLQVASESGCFVLKNDGSIDRTHIGGTAYIVDDETVAATDGAGTRSAAGEIKDVDSVGVHVQIG